MKLFLYFSIISLYILFAAEIIYSKTYWVNTPVLGIYEQPDIESPFATQELYGHTVTYLKTVNNAWFYIKTNDGVTGYCLEQYLLDQIPSADRQQLYRIKSITGCVYPSPNVINQTVIQLPYNAYITIITGPQDGWVQLQLLDGTYGWIMQEDIEPIHVIRLTEALKRAQMFIGIPYIWGGKSSWGYDCSGLVQTLAHQMGYYRMKRNSREQAHDPQLIEVDFHDIQPGDFVYFGKEGITHTAICLSARKIIHATNIDYKPQVVVSFIDHPALTYQCARRLPQYN